MRSVSVVSIVTMGFSVLNSAMVQADVPDTCLQLPERQTVCPHLLYKKSPLDVPRFGTRKGDIICLCMADFATFRIRATDAQALQQQRAALQEAAQALDLSEEVLKTLVRF